MVEILLVAGAWIDMGTGIRPCHCNQEIRVSTHDHSIDLVIPYQLK